jgi:hypothetical protein
VHRPVTSYAWTLIMKDMTPSCTALLLQRGQLARQYEVYGCMSWGTAL